MNKQDVWFFIAMIISSTIIFSIIIIATTEWTYTIKFEMDNNTLEAFKSINWSAIPK